MNSVAQERLESLSERFNSGSLHHGLLFRGDNLLFLEQSVGHLYRKILNIENNGLDHPDLFHLRPTGKARIITVEKTRSLLSQLHRSGHQSNRKVAIIHEVDRMRKEAANAFLKTLEEPPQGTYLFLLTTRPYSILPTIRSRTLMVRLEENSTQEKNQELENWIAHYYGWVELLMDRKKLKQDRVSPVFMAYGLIESLANLIKSTADDLTKEALSNLPDEVEDKEKDAFESGLRRGVRTKMLKVISDCTRSLITGSEGSSGILEHNGLKLTRVIRKLESTSGLLEVNLKEDAALEDFFLSSLRIWSSK